MDLTGDQYLTLARPRIFDKQEVVGDESELSQRLFASYEVHLNAIALYQREIAELNTKMAEQELKMRTLAMNANHALDRFESEAKMWKGKAILTEGQIQDLKSVHAKLKTAYTRLSDKNAMYKTLFDYVHTLPRRRLMSTGTDAENSSFTDYVRLSDLLYIMETGRGCPGNR